MRNKSLKRARACKNGDQKCSRCVREVGCMIWALYRVILTPARDEEAKIAVSWPDIMKAMFRKKRKEVKSECVQE